MKPTSRPGIENLIRQVARRHDAILIRKTAVTALLAAAALSVAASLFWVSRGHQVPAAIPLAAFVLGLILALARIISGRMSTTDAVLEADSFFGLKDGIATARHLSATAPEDPVTRLQWDWLSPRLAGCNPSRISSPFPGRRAALAAVLAIAALVLALLPPSASVRAAAALAEETRLRVTESRNELEQLIEELEKSTTSEEEKKNLRLDELRKLVNEIEETGDRSEAVRQFARLEQKVRESSRALDQQRDEETLKLAARELSKAEQTEARQLGRKLEEKDLREAADLLDKLTPKRPDAEALKKSPADRKDALDETRKDLAKMRAASKRLAAAGKQRQAANQARGASGAGSRGGDGQTGEAGGDPGKALEDLMVELDEAAAALEKNLDELEFDPDAKPCDGTCDNLDRMKAALGKHMRGMQAKRLAQSKLDALRQSLAQCQSYTQGQCQQLGLARAAGGKNPGTGSSWNERQERDATPDNGELAQLKGNHGSGPSLSAVEEADSGTGVSGRRGETRQREFSRQMESFVQRDDVPEPLKIGVRNYFENLQSTPTSEE